MNIIELLDEMKKVTAKLEPDTPVIIRTKFVDYEDKKIDEVFTEERSNGRTRLIIKTSEW